MSGQLSKPLSFMKRAMNPFFLILLLSLVSCSSEPNDTSSSKSSQKVERAYPVNLINYFAIDSDTLSIKFSVTNNGTQTVSPECQIRMRDESGAYRGFNVFYLEPISAGVTQAIVGTLTITNEGAEYVNEFKGECFASTSDKSSSSGKEVIISDIRNASATDGSEGWYWAAVFKVNQQPMTQMDCSVKALDKSGNVIAETAFRGNTLNDGTVTAYGQNESDKSFVDSTKAIVQSIESFDVKCTL